MGDIYSPRRRSYAPYLFAATLFLAGLKLVGLFPWDWVWVAVPLWGTLILALLVTPISFLIVLFSPQPPPVGPPPQRPPGWEPGPPRR